MLGVAQRAEALLHVAARWAERGDHGRLGVPAEALSQQPTPGQTKRRQGRRREDISSPFTQEYKSPIAILPLNN